MFTNRTMRWGIAVFVLALVVRMVYLLLSVHAFGDFTSAISAADDYYIVSHNLIAGHGLTHSTEPPYEPYSFRPPLFHFFIASTYLLFGGDKGVMVVHLLVASMIPIVGMILASYLTDGRWIQISVGIILALEPSAVLYSTMLYSETFFTFLLLLSFWALFVYLERGRMWQLVLSGGLLGLATLTRPTTEFVPVIVVGSMLWLARKHLTMRHVGHLAAYVMIFAAVLSPWVYRNWVVFSVPGISPQTGVNLRMTLLPTVLSIANGTTFQQEFDKLHQQGIKGPNEASITDGGPYTKAAIPALLAHPKALVLSAVNSLWSFFVTDGLFDFLRHIKIRPAETLGRPSLAALFANLAAFVSYFARNLFGPLALILVGRLLWIALTALFFIGVWRYFRTYGLRPAALIAVSLVVYLALTSAITGYGLTARYRLPVNAFILVFALYEVSALALRWQTRPSHKS